jgi:hypothetical protein
MQTTDIAAAYAHNFKTMQQRYGVHPREITIAAASLCYYMKDPESSPEAKQALIAEMANIMQPLRDAQPEAFRLLVRNLYDLSVTENSSEREHAQIAMRKVGDAIRLQ